MQMSFPKRTEELQLIGDDGLHCRDRLTRDFQEILHSQCNRLADHRFWLTRSAMQHQGQAEIAANSF
jgi:hypothetical protein